MIHATTIAGLQFEQPSFGPIGAIAIAVGLVVVAMAYTFGLRWRTQSPAMRMGLMSLRLGAILCLLIAMVHPVWLRARTVDRKPVLAVVIDDSESMGQPAPPPHPHPSPEQDDASSRSRYDVARSVLRDQLIRRFESTHELRVFDITGRRRHPDNLPEHPAQPHSPLTDTLLTVQQEFGDRPPAGIVLLSDGREATDRPSLGAIDQLRVPVHPIRIAPPAGRTGEASDLAIQSVIANQRALVGNAINVTVDIAADGYVDGVNVPVSILQGDRLVGSPVMVPWRGGQPAVRAELTLTPHRPGEFTYTVQVGGLRDEADLSNNRQTFDLSVRAKPLTVMYIDGVLRWEGKFTRQVLADDPDINVISSVRTARPGAGPGSQGLLLPEQLTGVDVVILGDVEATYFATSELLALRHWVTEQAGGLLLTGGYHSFGSSGFGRTELRRVLPVEFSAASNPQIEQPFSLKITDYGREHPIFHLSGDRVRDTAFYQSLPELAGCSRVAAVKPGAQVLATNPTITGATGAQGLPVTVVQEVGAGRTMVLAVDTTWRWRMVVGGFTGDSGFYQRFWGQIVRWLAGDDETAPRRLFLSTDRYRYERGQEIQLNVELPEPTGDVPRANRQLEAKAIDERGRVVAIPLVEKSPSHYTGTLTAARPGRLDIHVAARPSGEGDTDPAAHSRIITVQVDRDDLEQLDTQPSDAFLAQVAQLSGGRTVRVDQIDEWARQLPAEPVKAMVHAKARLWKHPALAAVFFALLCTEWILRRRNRLS